MNPLLVVFLIFLAMYLAFLGVLALLSWAIIQDQRLHPRFSTEGD